MAEEKWEGKAVAELAGTGAEEAWSALEDFCNLQKWFPIDTSYRLEGVPGQPGLTRYCASNVKGTIMWAKEKLLSIDPLQRCLSYEIVDNNLGFKSYVATLQVLPIHEGGCKIEWGFVSDPVEGWSFQDLKGYVESTIQFMANKIQLASSSLAAA
ncbi:lachrymatory-factor synthase [Cajanus cajan]|nr:lachrymatory-factor synthase [Cajanus cajan]